jgi:uncharacterized protein
MSNSQVFTGHVGIGEAVAGLALVAEDDFSARYDLDRVQGIFSRPTHKLYGENYVDTILVLNNVKGGVASAWMLREMTSRNMAPRALLLGRTNPIVAQGAAFAGMTLMDRFDTNLTQAIKTGDYVRVDPVAGTVTVTVTVTPQE